MDAGCKEPCIPVQCNSCIFGTKKIKIFSKLECMSCPSWQCNELEAVCLCFEPYWWSPCGVTWDSSLTVVVIKLWRTSNLYVSTVMIVVTIMFHYSDILKIFLLYYIMIIVGEIFCKVINVMEFHHDSALIPNIIYDSKVSAHF